MEGQDTLDLVRLVQATNCYARSSYARVDKPRRGSLRFDPREISKVRTRQLTNFANAMNNFLTFQRLPRICSSFPPPRAGKDESFINSK